MKGSQLRERASTGRLRRLADTFPRIGMFAFCLLLMGFTTEETFKVIPDEQPQSTQARFLAWNSTQPGWAQSQTGLQFHRVSTSNPSGATPQADSIVTVQCAGRFIDGKPFFATTPDRPLTGPLTKLIKGWQEGLLLMHVGETWEFALPPDLAYGEKGWVSKSPSIPSIPPQTALLFKIELLAVTNPPQAASDRRTP